MHSRPERVWLGIVIIVLTVFAMSTADMIVKLFSAALPLWQIYVVRSLMVIPMLAAFAIFRRGAIRITPISPGWVALRSLLLAFMYIFIYAAAPVLSLSVIAATLYTGPLFIALFSALLIGEPVGPRRWSAIALGFVGVIVIIRPAASDFTTLALIPIVAAILYALANVLTRAKARDESPLVLGFALNYALMLVGLAATLTIALWSPSEEQAGTYPFLLGYWVSMGSQEWMIVAALALLMVGISVGLAKAYQSAPPAVIATFDYAYLGFAAFWSFAVFHEAPDLPTIVGLVLIAGAGLMVMGGPSKARPAAAEAEAA
ncbi:MAG TPA: DMT family transporter [Alphaproteobacteria bacterium]